ncbi:MAG: hypothetical protein JXQ75_03825 [Phycisphaerae bacterium]|nr:hypothetical protein [Phycisphaerae bacterium]
MAFRIKCACGKLLKASSDHAGGELVCPACGKPIRVPAEMFTAAAEAQHERTPTPGAAKPASPVPIELDVQPANLALEFPPTQSQPGEPTPRRGDFQIEMETDARHDEPAAPPAAAPVETGEPAAVGYASESLRQRPYAFGASDDVEQRLKEGFWADAFASFSYPFTCGSNAAMFLVISLIALLYIPLGMVGRFGIVGHFVVTGWLCALYLSVVHDTASGSNDLPGIKVENGVVDGLLIPAVRYLGAFGVPMAPAAFLSIALSFNLVPGWLGSLSPILWIVGAFFIPLSLLLFSFDAVNAILRIDLVFRTIARTLIPYLTMWIMLLIVGIAYAISISPSFLAKIGLQSLIPPLPSLGVGGEMVFIILKVYLTVVAMRIVGLYYLHFRKRFAFVME